MSANHYARHPNHPAENKGLHIGQYSNGWEFLFRAHKDLELTSTEAWRKFLDHPWVRIVAEHGAEETSTEFWKFVSNADKDRRREWEESFLSESYPRWRDEDGYQFADYEFC